jgi:hypothetical protein
MRHPYEPEKVIPKQKTKKKKTMRIATPLPNIETNTKF